jgi:hypothetical protein
MGVDTITTVVVPAVAAFQGQARYDLVSLASVKAELNIVDQSKDANLKTWITQSSSAAAKFCNRVFPVELLQDQIFAQRDHYPQVVTGGARPLQLSRWPIATTPCRAGIAAPPAPLLSSVPGGVLPGARCYVRATYVTAAGETAVSAESNVMIGANALLQVASPPPDPLGRATGWNVYVSTASGTEILQNAAPMAIGTPWTEAVTGLVTAGTAMPSFVSVIENGNPRIEGIDFLTDFSTGQLRRLDTNGYVKGWPALAIVVLCPAGYVLTDPIFSDAADAVTRMVKGRYFAQNRDPALRQENVEGTWSAQYWFAAGPGAAVGNLAPDIEAILEKYRVPVMG